MELGTILVVILLSLGAVQGIVFGLILVFAKEANKTANYLLATMLFLLSYRLLIQILRLFGLGHYDIWYHWMIDVNWIYGALIYFFVKAQVIPNFRLTKRDWIHFLPLLIQIICSNFVRAQNFYWDGTKASLSWAGYWGYVVWMNYPTIHVIASLLIVIYSFKAEQLINSQNGQVKIADTKLQWTLRIIRSFRIYFSLVILILLSDLLWYEVTIERWYYYFERYYYYPFFIGVAILTYWLGLVGFNRRKEEAVKYKPKISEKEQVQLEQIASRLEIIMQQEQLFKNPTLSLNDLAEKLNTKTYLLSKCLKLQFGQKFPDYINLLRLEELKQLLADPANEQFTLLSLAFEAGFNSKASFNRAVKKHYGLSPKDLKANLKSLDLENRLF